MMTPRFSFHPDALLEYGEAADYYLREASQDIAERFSSTIESAIAAIVAAPMRWRIVETPEIRRYVVRRFPFVIYYLLLESGIGVVAIAHKHRRPGYWKRRKFE